MLIALVALNTDNRIKADVIRAVPRAWTRDGSHCNMWRLWFPAIPATLSALSATVVGLRLVDHPGRVLATGFILSVASLVGWAFVVFVSAFFTPCIVN